MFIAPVYLRPFVFAMFGTALAFILLRRPRRELVFLVIPLLLLALPELPAPSRPLSQAVSIQPNIPERDDWTDRLALETQQRLPLCRRPVPATSRIAMPLGVPPVPRTSRRCERK